MKDTALINTESTSVYFNNIVKRNVEPITIADLSETTVAEFNRQVGMAFTEEQDITVRRVHYLIPYILQNIDWEEYAIPLEAWQLRYYYQRDRFIEKTGLDYDRFLNHEPLQRAIGQLGLMPEPVFEFILFLKYYYGLRSDLKFSCIEQFDALVEKLNMASDEEVSMDVCIGGKHIKINNSNFIKRIFQVVDRSKLSAAEFINEFDQGSSRDKIRALDYYIVKTLLDYLPTDKSLRRGGRFSQAERNFGLSVLSFCGRLPDIDREGECSQENNATFDKLMRDFKGQPIPFAMELFL
ncbi:MAG: hypothetical protein K2J82_10795 [Muribaculaceae bacterium]|nr:hypothetical protein [Muribaculaceae bacterium]